MAEIADDGGGGGGHGKKGKKRAKKNSTRVDMTPLVDLAFLLLTFFVLTSTFSDPRVMKLTYPAKPKDDKKEQQEPVNNAITFLLSKDRVFYYEGVYHAPGNPEGEPVTKIEEADYSPTSDKSVRALLIRKNDFVLRQEAPLKKQWKENKISEKQYKDAVAKIKRQPQALSVLVKADDKATCRNFIDVIDELKICNIGLMAPMDMLKSEQDLINAKMGK